MTSYVHRWRAFALLAVAFAQGVSAADKRRNTQTFTYDDLYRLTRVQYNLPTPSPANGGEINYRYDRIGNMLAQTSDIAHVEELTAMPRLLALLATRATALLNTADLSRTIGLPHWHVS